MVECEFPKLKAGGSSPFSLELTICILCFFVLGCIHGGKRRQTRIFSTFLRTRRQGVIFESFCANFLFACILFQQSVRKGLQNPLCARDVVWAQEELNVRPHAYQACALTTELYALLGKNPFQGVCPSFCKRLCSPQGPYGLLRKVGAYVKSKDSVV